MVALVQHNPKIASMFRDYYAALYNLDPNVSPADIAQKQARIEAYLSSSGLPNLTLEQQAAIEVPISQMELATVKSLPEEPWAGWLHKGLLFEIYRENTGTYVLLLLFLGFRTTSPSGGFTCSHHCPPERR